MGSLVFNSSSQTSDTYQLQGAHDLSVWETGIIIEHNETQEQEYAHISLVCLTYIAIIYII